MLRNCFLCFFSSSFCFKYNFSPLLPFFFFFFLCLFSSVFCWKQTGRGITAAHPSVNCTLQNKPTGLVHMQPSTSKTTNNLVSFEDLESSTCSYPRTVSHHTVSRYPLPVSLFISLVSLWQSLSSRLLIFLQIFLLRLSPAWCCFIFSTRRTTKPQRRNVLFLFFSFSVTMQK